MSLIHHEPPAGEPPAGEPPAGEPPAGEPPGLSRRPGAVNVADYLPLMAQRQPTALAVAAPCGPGGRRRARYAGWTFQQLNDASDRLAVGLKAAGIDRGVRTVLMVRPGLELFALTFALFKVGAVPVLVDPGMGIGNLGRCLAEAKPAAFIGIPQAQLARMLFGWAKKTVRILVTLGRRWLWGGWTVQELARRRGKALEAPGALEPDETAAILFTSGSTGVPKGAVYTHGIFSAQVELLRRTYAIQPGEVDLCTFPLFALFAPALGMTAIVPDMDPARPAQVEPRNIIEPIEEFGVTNLFGSPALLRRVISSEWARHRKLPTLRRVVSAGAPVPADVLEQFVKLLPPGAQVFTPYGATEALPVCSIGSDEILGETRTRTAQGGGACVGRPVAGMTVRVIRIADEPIAAWSDDLLLARGEIGEIVVQGPVVTREYYNRPEQTALAKIADPEHGSFYHRMGDLGYFDEQGRLWFCGRKSQRVVTSAGTLFTIPCEAVFNTHPAVLRTALVGIGRPGAARPVLCVELRPGADSDREALRGELAAQGAARPHTRGITTFLFHTGFPVDVRHNSKILREKLARWAARQLS